MERLVGKMEGYGENRWESGGVAAKGIPGVGLALPWCSGAPDRILPHKGRHESAGSFIGLAHALAQFWGRRCGPFLGPEPKIHASHVLGGVLKAPMEILLDARQRGGGSGDWRHRTVERVRE
jgi:hypothetical protein